MATVNKDFVIKNGLQVGGLTTLASPANSGSIYFPSSGSDAVSPAAGHLWRNGNSLKIYLGASSGTKTLAYLDSTFTGTWNGTIISPTYGGTGVNNGSSTITIGGNVTFSGAYTTSFTVGATTALTLPASGTVAVLGNKLSDFASTSSSELAGVITGETGTGALTFATSPTFTTSIDSGATFAAFASATDLTIGATTSAQNLRIGNGSTQTSSYYLATGATASANTKTVEIGTGGLSGSTTNISIGSTTGTSTTTVNQNLIVGGDLTVQGTTTTVNSTTVVVADKNIELAVPASPGSPSDTNANGGGVIVKGNTDHSILWYNGSPRQYWQFNSGIDLVSGTTLSINGTETLSNTALSISDTQIKSTNGAVSVTTTSSTVFGSFSTSYRAAKFLITLTQGSDYMVTELLVLHNGTNGYVTEYGRMQVGSTIDATIDADVGVGVVNVSVTSTSASVGSPLNVKYTYTAITA